MQVPLDVLQLELHVGPKLLVQRTERLVHQEDPGTEHEGPGQRHSLLLTARELARQPPIVALQPHELQRLAHSLVDLGSSRPTNLQRERDVVEDGQMWEHGVTLKDHAEVALLRR